MSIAAFFKQVGAPLANQRWSWGGVRDDGTVVLRVWQHQTRKVDGTTFFRATDHQLFEEDQENFGYKERNQHIELVREGARCLMIVCIAKDPKTQPNKIDRFINGELFLVGVAKDIDGDTWLEFKDRRDWRELIE